MTRRQELAALLLADAVGAGAAFALQFAARFAWAWFGRPDLYPSAFWPPLVLLSAYWLVVFAFFGLYRERFAASRLDELATLGKAAGAGVLVLVFAIYLDALRPGSSRSALFFYAGAMYGCTALGRVGVRTVQKRLILRGFGRHRTLVVGSGARVDALLAEVRRYPEAGLEIVGAVRVPSAAAQPVLVGAGGDGGGALPAGAAAGTGAVGDGAHARSEIERLPAELDRLRVQDVLVTFGGEDYDALLDVLRVCDRRSVTLKLVPDFYTLIGGMARTEHLYGLPLIEVFPSPMPPWQESTKRLLDVAVAGVVLAVGAPVWAAVALAVRLTSPGPVLYRQERVGQHGEPFTILKFRTMRADAEAATGPVWAKPDDDRYTPIGRWLRGARLDEAPQLWNVLKGDMSLVGPRPERPFFVERLAADIPLYTRRHRVKPGITGWAQVKRPYDATVEDVRTKVKYDLFYIENMSLGMDLQILLRTIRTALRGEGH